MQFCSKDAYSINRFARKSTGIYTSMQKSKLHPINKEAVVNSYKIIQIYVPLQSGINDETIPSHKIKSKYITHVL